MSRRDALGMFWYDEPKAPKQAKEVVKVTPPERTWERADYLPNLEEACNAVFPLMTAADLLLGAEQKQILVFDIEIYRNYFLAAFFNIETKKYIFFELDDNERSFDPEQLHWVLTNFTTVGFNSLSYDLPLMTLAINGLRCSHLKEQSDRIIQTNEFAWAILRQFGVKDIKCDHIDLIEVAPLRGSLKIYGGRIHSRRMQDLPFPPHFELNEDQKIITKWYCVNDTDNTVNLYQSLKKQIDLRVTLSNEYEIDLRSKSDAQIAEAVIAQEVTARIGYRPKKPSIDIGTVYKYRVPEYLQFQTPVLQSVLLQIANADFVVGEYGAITAPQVMKDLRPAIGSSVYQMGIGGLHSMEKRESHWIDSQTRLMELDVTSYYPYIILNQELFPRQLTPAFLHVFRTIVNRRVEAKHKGDKVTADSLKITINGSFGKLGSPFSILYSPDLLLQVTVSGQLSLLFLIEMMELSGMSVVSANTDGLVIKYTVGQEPRIQQVVDYWQKVTGYELEANDFIALLSRDVNNYIAVKAPGKGKTAPSIKSKGAYAKSDLSKNPTGDICIDAIEQYLIAGTPIEQTITTCTDIRRFVTVRNVTGGAVKEWGESAMPAHSSREDLIRQAGYYEFVEGYWLKPNQSDREALPLVVAYEQAQRDLRTVEGFEYLGKAIRWYYAKGVEGNLIYASRGSKVPKTQGAKPLMILPDTLPSDIDYERYIEQAYEMLEDTGFTAR